MKDNREAWNLINTTSRTITSGFPFVRAIGPGKSTDLLSSVSKEAVRQSKGVALLLERAWARIEIVVDGVLVRTVTYENIDDLNDSTLSITLDENGDGNIDLQGQSLNLGLGTGESGGNVVLDGGSVVFNNDVSLSSTGSIISVNCSEFVTASDLSVYGDLTVYGVAIVGLPVEEPNLTSNNSYALYQDGPLLVLKARDKVGRIVKVELSNFETEATI